MPILAFSHPAEDQVEEIKVHGFNLRTHNLLATLIEELAGPGWREVIPELLEILLEQIGPKALEVAAQCGSARQKRYWSNFATRWQDKVWDENTVLQIIEERQQNPFTLKETTESLDTDWEGTAVGINQLANFSDMNHSIQRKKIPRRDDVRHEKKSSANERHRACAGQSR